MEKQEIASLAYKLTGYYWDHININKINVSKQDLPYAMADLRIRECFVLMGLSYDNPDHDAACDLAISLTISAIRVIRNTDVDNMQEMLDRYAAEQAAILNRNAA